MKPIIIGIAGGSGSGKTTVARNILSSVKESGSVLIDHDSYYKDQSHLTTEERKKVNYDHPDALDNELLCEQLKQLKKGFSIEKPVYDFVTYTRLSNTDPIAPENIIILEGFLIFSDPKIRKLIDIKIYVDTDDDLRVLRRIESDIKERGRSFDSVVSQYLETVKPMYHQFVEPTKRYADIIIPRGGHNQIAIDMVVARLKSLQTSPKK